MTYRLNWAILRLNQLGGPTRLEDVVRMASRYSGVDMDKIEGTAPDRRSKYDHFKAAISAKLLRRSRNNTNNKKMKFVCSADGMWAKFE